MENPSEHSSISLLNTELERHGFVRETIVLDKKSYSRFTSPTGAVWVVQDAHISYPFMSAAVQKISREKIAAHELADLLKVTSPRTTMLDTFPSKDIAEALIHYAPLVVKPNSASLSKGVTLNVMTVFELESALEVAFSYSDAALVQKQIEGDEIRFVVVSGKVEASLLRQTPRVVGDGKSSVGVLIEQENRERDKLKMPYLSYPQLNESILGLGTFDLTKIPLRGEVIELGRGTMIKTGASVYNVMDEVHSSYIELAEKLVTSLGADFIVVDMIIQDYAQIATDQNYAFLEFNSAPVLKLFYSCRNGKHYDVLRSLIPLIKQTLEHKSK